MAISAYRFVIFAVHDVADDLAIFEGGELLHTVNTPNFYTLTRKLV